MPAACGHFHLGASRVKRKPARQAAPKDTIALGGKQLRIEYNFLAYSIMREACGVSPLDGVDFAKFTEAQYVAFLAAGLETHQPELDVKWLATQLNFRNFQHVMDVAVPLYVAGLPKKSAAVNPPKPAA